jgi:hypothetical protein
MLALQPGLGQVESESRGPVSAVLRMRPPGPVLTPSPRTTHHQHTGSIMRPPKMRHARTTQSACLR